MGIFYQFLIRLLVVFEFLLINRFRIVRIWILKRQQHPAVVALIPRIELRLVTAVILIVIGSGTMNSGTRQT